MADSTVKLIMDLLLLIFKMKYYIACNSWKQTLQNDQENQKKKKKKA